MEQIVRIQSEHTGKHWRQLDDVIQNTRSHDIYRMVGRNELVLFSRYFLHSWNHATYGYAG